LVANRRKADTSIAHLALSGGLPNRVGYATSLQINQPIKDHGMTTTATAASAAKP
jgi:hypothetical protein